MMRFIGRSWVLVAPVVALLAVACSEADLPTADAGVEPPPETTTTAPADPPTADDEPAGIDSDTDAVEESASPSEPAEEPTPTVRTEPLLVIDAFGNEVTIPASPQRVFAGDDTSLANLLSLGVRPAGMAVNQNAVPDFLAEQLDGIEDLSVEGGLRVNVEGLAALAPDLIIGPGTTLLQVQYGLVSEIAPTYAYEYGYASSEEIRTNLTDVARLFGLENRADEIVAALDARVADLAGRLAASDDPDITVSVLRIFADGFGLSLRHGTTESVLMQEIGIQRPANQQSIEAFATEITMETLNEAAADVIYLYVDDPTDTSEYDAILESPLWQTLEAVQNDRVFLVDGGIWNGISIAAAHLILDDLEATLGL
ncbi:MAG: ABC transporter substrate-binding protein [Actinomycetota bacterium]